jgi:hypothetical protein
MMLLVVAAMGVAVLAIPAAAGEVRGPPGPDGAEGGATPIAGFWTGDGAASICSFSGLNDEIITEPVPGYEPTMTQSYGTFIGLFGKEAVDSNPEGGPPGLACNPTKGPNPKGVGR